MLYPNDADGNAIRANLAPALAKAGFTIVDPGPYEDGTTDYSAQIAKFKAEKCEIFNTFPIPPDFAAFWRQAAQQGYTKMVKIAQIAKTGLFPSEVEALGDLGFNLASAAYWHRAFPYKSSLTGVSGDELADGYEKASGKQWTQQLGATHVAVRRRRRGAEGQRRSRRTRRAVAKAISTLKTTTIDRQDRFHQRACSQRLARADHRHAMGQGAGGIKFKLDYVMTEMRPTRTSRSAPSSCRSTAERPRAARRRGDRGRHLLDGAGLSTSALARLWCSTTSISSLARRRSRRHRRPERRRQDDAAQHARRRARADERAASRFAATTSRRCRQPSAAGSGLVRTHQIPRPFGGMTVFENVFVAAAHGGGLSGRGGLSTAAIDSLDALRHAGGRQPARRDAGAARPQAARTRARAGDQSGGAAARRDRRRPDRRRGERTRRRRSSSCARRGIAIVWIEHIVHVLLQVAERLICMDAGRIIADGEPRAVMADPGGRSRPISAEARS